MPIGWSAPLTGAKVIAGAGLDFLEVPITQLDLEIDTSFVAAKAVRCCITMQMPRVLSENEKSVTVYYFP